MNLGDLISAFRIEADDTAEPYLHSRLVLVKHANQAQYEAARRSRCLLDATTPDVCQYAVKANDPWVTLHPKVIRVEHAQLETPITDASPQIDIVYREMRYDLERRDANWRESKGGGVCRYIPDIETGKLRLYRTPTVAGVLNLEVARLPLNMLKEDRDCVEIPEQYAADLVYWMLWRAYSKRDADTYDEGRAREYLALFEQVFGTRSSTSDEVWTGQSPGMRRSTVRFY